MNQAFTDLWVICSLSKTALYQIFFVSPLCQRYQICSKFISVSTTSNSNDTIGNLKKSFSKIWRLKYNCCLKRLFLLSSAGSIICNVSILHSLFAFAVNSREVTIRRILNYYWFLASYKPSFELKV